MADTDNSSNVTTGGFTRALYYVRHPTRFLPPYRTVRNKLNTMRGNGIMVLISHNNGATRLLPILSIDLRGNTAVVNIARGVRSPVTGRSSVMVPVRVRGRDSGCGVRTATDCVTAVTLFSTLVYTVVRRASCRGRRFTLVRPNKTMKTELGGNWELWSFGALFQV